MGLASRSTQDDPDGNRGAMARIHARTQAVGRNRDAGLDPWNAGNRSRLTQLWLGRLTDESWCFLAVNPRLGSHHRASAQVDVRAVGIRPHAELLGLFLQVLRSSQVVDLSPEHGLLVLQDVEIARLLGNLHGLCLDCGVEHQETGQPGSQHDDDEDGEAEPSHPLLLNPPWQGPQHRT